jgi:ATP-dependent RNA circularization protein (DNA/RNA ligase family)
VTDDFFKFPSTPHLAILGDIDLRDDKVMSEPERNDFLRHELIVEEKVDGANLGISFDRDANVRVQNRGSYLQLPGVGQWKKLAEWLAPKVDALFEQLSDRFILFGEWCYARHTVAYDRLPDWFLGFDAYDRKAARFFSAARRNDLLEKAGIIPVPQVARGVFTLDELSGLLAQSRFGDRPAEGLYLRSDEGDWLARRAKLVRPAFIQSIEDHWSHSGVTANRLKTF